MADKEIKYTFTGDAKQFNQTVKEAESEVRSIPNKLKSVFSGVTTKLLGIKDAIGTISQGIQAWGKVIKTLVFDRPLESLKQYAEAIQNARESLNNTSARRNTKNAELMDIIKELKEINTLEASWEAKQQRANVLIKNANALFRGNKQKLWFDTSSGRVEGLWSYETEAKKYINQMDIQAKKKEISDINEELKTQRELLSQLQKQPVNYWTGDKQAEAASRMSKLSDDLAKAKDELARLERVDIDSERHLEWQANLTAARKKQAAEQAAYNELVKKGEKEEAAAVKAQMKERQRTFDDYQKKRMAAEREYATEMQTAQKAYMRALQERFQAEQNFARASAHLAEVLHGQELSKVEKHLNKIIQKASGVLNNVSWYDSNPDKRTPKQKRLDESIARKMEQYAGRKNIYGILSKNEKERYDEVMGADRQKRKAERKLERMGETEQAVAQSKELTEARAGVEEAARKMQEAGNAVNALAQPMAQLASGIDRLNKNNVWFVEGR